MTLFVIVRNVLLLSAALYGVLLISRSIDTFWFTKTSTTSQRVMPDYPQVLGDAGPVSLSRTRLHAGYSQENLKSPKACDCINHGQLSIRGVVKEEVDGICQTAEGCCERPARPYGIELASAKLCQIIDKGWRWDKLKGLAAELAEKGYPEQEIIHGLEKWSDTHEPEARPE